MVKKKNEIFTNNVSQSFVQQNNNVHFSENRKKYWRRNKYKNFLLKISPIQILFATTTSIYADIVRNAAEICHMPFHEGRWLSGSITARASYITDIQSWRPLIDFNTKTVMRYFQKKYLTLNNKRAYSQNIKFSWKEIRQPSVIIIPDIGKSLMIVRESKKIGIPIIGLINSDQLISVDYPLMGNSDSIHLVNFFCHFLANMISKQIINNCYTGFRHLMRNQFTMSQINKRRKRIIVEDTIALYNKPFLQKKTNKIVNVHKIKDIFTVFHNNYNRKLKKYQLEEKIRKQKYQSTGKLYGVYNDLSRKESVETDDFLFKRKRLLSRLVPLFINITLKQKINFLKKNKFIYFFLLKAIRNIKVKSFYTAKTILKLEYSWTKSFFNKYSYFIALWQNASNYIFSSNKIRNHYFLKIAFYNLLQKKIYRRTQKYAKNNPYYWSTFEKLSGNTYVLQNLVWIHFLLDKKILQERTTNWTTYRYTYKNYLKWRKYEKKYKKERRNEKKKKSYKIEK